MNDIVIVTVYSGPSQNLIHSFVDLYFLNEITFNEISKGRLPNCMI
jgi:hypothetical protein